MIKRERVGVGRDKGKGEGERSRLCPELEPEAGLDLMTLRSQPKLQLRVGCLTDHATQVSTNGIFLKYKYIFYIF